MPATETEILARLTAITREVFADPSLELTPDMATTDVPGWDSIGQTALIVEIERAFAIGIDPLAIDDVVTVGDLVRLVQHGAGTR